MKRAACIALIGLAACSALRPGTTWDGAHFSAPPDEVVRLRAIVLQYEQEVIDRLGSRWPRPYLIEVHELRENLLGQADDDSKRIRLAPRAVEDQERTATTLVHELVHVHAIGHWTELPYAVQEGLAYWLSLSLVQHVDRYTGPEPDPETLSRALTISREEYQSMTSTREIDQAATWLAAHLLEVRP